MAKASTKSKRKYNKAHYGRFTVECNSELLEATKEKCIKEGVSVSSVLTAAMRDFVKMPVSPPKTVKVSKPTLRGRREAITKMSKQLDRILDEEQSYQNAIPENFRTSHRFSDSEDAVTHLMAALWELKEAY